MEDFDPAIAVAVTLAVEEETDVPKRKLAKWSGEWFGYFSCNFSTNTA